MYRRGAVTVRGSATERSRVEEGAVQQPFDKVPRPLQPEPFEKLTICALVEAAFIPACVRGRRSVESQEAIHHQPISSQGCRLELEASDLEVAVWVARWGFMGIPETGLPITLRASGSRCRASPTVADRLSRLPLSGSPAGGLCVLRHIHRPLQPKQATGPGSVYHLRGYRGHQQRGAYGTKRRRS